MLQVPNANGPIKHVNLGGCVPYIQVHKTHANEKLTNLNDIIGLYFVNRILALAYMDHG